MPSRRGRVKSKRATRSKRGCTKSNRDDDYTAKGGCRVDLGGVSCLRTQTDIRIMGIMYQRHVSGISRNTLRMAKAESLKQVYTDLIKAHSFQIMTHARPILLDILGVDLSMTVLEYIPMLWQHRRGVSIKAWRHRLFSALIDKNWPCFARALRMIDVTI